MVGIIMGNRYKALKRSGKFFDQKDFVKSTKSKPENNPIKNVPPITLSENTTRRLKLMRYNTSFSRLLKLVLDMSEREQLRLLEYARSIIDDRTLPRHICMIPASCRFEEQTYDGLILDINSYGAYVDTDKPFPTGHDIYISFFNPFSDRHMDLGGKIVWSSTNGIGMSFNDLSRARFIW
jgi:hypothetical protein